MKPHVKFDLGSYRQFGIILIIIGVVGILLKTNVIGWENIWPLFLVGGGIGFFAGFFRNRQDYGLLMPATILTIYGLLFIYTSSGNWESMGNLWPTFVIAPGVGFFMMYFLGKRDSGLLVAGSILVAVSLLFYLQMWRVLKWWPVILIAVGLWLLLTKKTKPEQSESSQVPEKREYPGK